MFLQHDPLPILHTLIDRERSLLFLLHSLDSLALLASDREKYQRTEYQFAETIPFPLAARKEEAGENEGTY